MSAKAFTLIEVLIVIGILAILATMMLIAINPARQFKLARDSQRTANLSALVDAIHEDMSEHRGTFMCGGAPRAVPTSPTVLRNGSAADFASCLVPDYMSALPFDPTVPGAHYSSALDYDTAYEIWQDASGRITASTTGELSTSISVTR